MSEGIHFVCNSSQPEVKIHCTGEWKFVDFDQHKEQKEGVYLSTAGPYSFRKSLVTCPECLRRLEKW